MRELIE
jgi:hypothetical protein